MIFAQYLISISLFSNLAIIFFQYGVLKTFNIKGRYLRYLISVSFLCLTFLFTEHLYLNIVSDFTFINVKNTSNISEPLFYKICGCWGNHEGSILLWCWLLNLYTFSILIFKKNFKNFVINEIVALQSSFLLFFIIFIFSSSNPFLRQSFINFKGSQLNPLLQDFSLAIHPPILYLGYLGFSLVFSLIFIHLKLIGKNTLFLKMLNLYLTLAWAFLTLGIFLGCWWAYYELGWGGWWFWDPVENISLFPWLVALILIHVKTLSLTNFLGRIYVYFFGLLSFIIVILGIFFVRSGFLTSVHTFAVDVQRGYFLGLFLIFIVILALFSILRLNSRGVAPCKKSFIFLKEHTHSIGALIFVVFLMCSFFIFILIGTFSPTLIKLFYNEVYVLGASFFNEISFSFIFITLFYFIFNVRGLKNYYFFILNFFALVFLVLFQTMFVQVEYIFYIYFLLLFFNLVVYNFFKYYSFSFFAHVLFIFFICAIFLSWFGFFEYFNLLTPGNSVYFLNYLFIFKGYNIINSFNYYTLFGNFLLVDWFQQILLGTSFPEKRFYFLENFSGVKANIMSNYFADIYTIIGDGNLISGWYVHLIYHPGMPLIWIIGVLFFFLLLLSFLNKFNRYSILGQNKILW